MYIHSVKVENIRGFGKGQLDLVLQRKDGSYAGWTVIAGRNGSGKSTLLRAIALAVVGVPNVYRLQTSFMGWIHREARSGSVSVTVVPGELDSFQQSGKRSKQMELELSWAGPQGTEPSLQSASERQGSKRVAAPQRGPWSENATGWFLAGYGPFRRLFGHAADAQRVMAGPPSVARVGTLFREDASLLETMEWLRDLRLREADNDPKARELKETAFALLNDGLLPDSALRVSKFDAQGLWLQRGDGPELLLNDLSDGYRAVAALVLDVIRSLRVAYGALTLKDGAIQEPGVVLIDEVDAHLHPSWQKSIGPWLMRHFPNIQFIVTTHSPFVCQSADSNGLVILPEPNSPHSAVIADDELYKRAIHGSVDQLLLSDLFGMDRTWSDESQRKRLRYEWLEQRVLKKKATEAEQAEYNELRGQLRFGFAEDIERAAKSLKRASGGK